MMEFLVQMDTVIDLGFRPRISPTEEILTAIMIMLVGTGMTLLEIR